MILSELKSYIFSRNCVSREELAKTFALSEDGVDAMLEMWIKKGKVSRIVDLDKQEKVKRIRYRALKVHDIQLTVFS